MSARNVERVLYAVVCPGSATIGLFRYLLYHFASSEETRRPPRPPLGGCGRVVAQWRVPENTFVSLEHRLRTIPEISARDSLPMLTLHVNYFNACFYTLVMVARGHWSNAPSDSDHLQLPAGMCFTHYS